ncbi:glnH domain protein, partial [Mycobacterium avium MAV_120809_2495]
TPVGMEQLPPQPPLPPDGPDQNCDLTASLRPFPTKAEADAAVADIRARGRLIVGLDIGSNLFSFRDPITGEITGFDVDIAGEARSPATSSARPRTSSTGSCRRTSGSPRCSAARSTSWSRP